MLSMFIFFMVVYFFEPIVGYVYTKLFPKYVIGEIQVDEDLETYWASLNHDQKNWSICEEKNSR